MISRMSSGVTQRERISSGLTSLIREHNKMGSGNSSSSPQSSRRDKLLGLCNPSPSLSDSTSANNELIEEEVWAVAERPDDLAWDHDRWRQPDVHSNRLFSKWLSSSSISSSNVHNWDGTGIPSSASSSSRVSTPLRRIQQPSVSESGSTMPQSAPMNVPDWSKILDKNPSRDLPLQEYNEGEKENQEEEWLPPHVLVARSRSRTATFSVLEGAGRTLKGRDLSRVRNAVWKQTGFLA